MLPAHAGMIPGDTKKQKEEEAVLPAHAGMIPAGEFAAKTLIGAPRSRGDDPSPSKLNASLG